MPFLPRGVYRAPLLSPEGYPILFAVTAEHRFVNRYYIGPHDDPYAILDRLYAELDAADPDHVTAERPTRQGGAQGAFKALAS